MRKRVLGLLAASTVALWGGVAFAANGCPSGTYDVVVSPDGTSYSVPGFSDWFVDTTTTLTTCAISIPLQNPGAAGNIVVFTSDIRGYRYLEGGDEVELEVDQDGTKTTFTDNGPADADFLVTDLVAVKGGEIDIDGRLELTDSTGNGFATVDSLDYTELGRITTPTDQTAAIVHLGATAGLLTGGLQPIEDGNSIALMGGYGSYMFGGTGRYNISDGFSVLGGVSLVNQRAGASTTSGVLGAIAIRYVEPGINSFRPLAEGGLVVGALQVDYPNVGPNVPTGLGTIYGKGGFISDLTPETKLAIYGTLAETGLGSSAFTQTFPAFTVNVPAQTGFFTTTKATAAITAELAPTVDLTAEASVGMVFSHSGMTATIPTLGTVNAAQNSAFVDYGVRLGWEPDPMVKLSVFAQGSIGQDVGVHNQIGATAKLKF